MKFYFMILMRQGKQKIEYTNAGPRAANVRSKQAYVLK